MDFMARDYDIQLNSHFQHYVGLVHVRDSSLLLYTSIETQRFAAPRCLEEGERISAYENGSITDLAKRSAPKTVLGSGSG